MKKFIILAQPRTGSTLITSLIQYGAPKGIRCINEPINPVGHSHHMKPMVRPENKHKNMHLIPQSIVHNNIIRALDICFRPVHENVRPDVKDVTWIKHKIDGRIAAGFKIMAHHIMALKQQNKFWEYLHRHDVKTIIVRRRNILMQWISDLIVKETRQCVVWHGQVKRARVKVPLDQLETNLDRINAENDYLLEESKNLDRKIVEYEDFKENYAVVEQLLPWLLGIKYKVKAQCAKQNPDSMRERVTNYDLLCRKLQELGLNEYLID